VSLLVDLAMCALGWRCERGKPRSCGSFVSARRGFRGRWRSRGEITTIPVRHKITVDCRLLCAHNVSHALHDAAPKPETRP
jgi:hypothetical protein